ncbi:hypothetical protein WIS52_13985 [Pseudonocardia nematodicida]|uniref:DUF559 domain-containing protein n=1 Tax=Pseudonocardia nematodicida TaxID=1206997 RepID=A0ABV1KAS0_9PSEU
MTRTAPDDRRSGPRTHPPSPRDDEALDRLIAAQAGVVTRAQAVAHGLSPDTVDRRLAARRWRPEHPCVYRDARHPATDGARVIAAVLWAGEGAVLTGAAAAWWWGLTGPGPAPDVVTVTVPRRRAPRSRPGVTVRRRGLPAADVVRHAGIAVAAPAFAALEAAVELGDAAGPALLGRLVTGPGPRTGAPAVDLAALTAAHRRNLGAHGSAATGRLLATVSRSATASALRRMRALLVRDGTDGWRVDHAVAGIVVRLAFPAARLAVEIRGDGPDDDGRGWRRAVLRRQGWRVLVLDPADPWARPGATLAAVRHAVAGNPAGSGVLPAGSGGTGAARAAG